MYRVFDVTIGNTALHKLSDLMGAFDVARSRSTIQFEVSELRVYFDDTNPAGVLYFCDGYATGAPPTFYGNKLGSGDQTVFRQEGNWIPTQEIYVATSTATGRIH